jgi:hypothetical protein
MSNNGLDPSDYDLQPFTQELRSDLKVLCLAAVRKAGARPILTPAGIPQPVAAGSQLLGADADLQDIDDQLAAAQELLSPVQKKPQRLAVWLVVAFVAVLVIACLAVSGGGIQDFFQSIVNGLSTGTTPMP